ncbi:ead/Ea22-like family protein [Pseudomonas aeruginosa]|uniref:ead/Ea22-like family protein n=1 Tax=Pseudomonas aeruginosa TaxID=287 RepID=UPI00366A7CB0
MTDHAELRRLAELADALYGMPSLEHEYAISKFRVASTPKTILAMLDEIDGLLAQHGRDSSELRALCQARDDARKERDRLKAENEVLRGALQAVVDDPTWRSNDNTLWPKIIKAMDKGTKS